MTHQSPQPRPARLVREAVPFVLLVCACGAAVTEVPGLSASPPSTPGPASASAAPAPAASESFDDLAAKAPALAPGMHEAARRSGGLDALELWRAEQGDACLRVAFASSSPVTATLRLQTGELLAASAQAAVEGALGEKGPVCVRKGDIVKGVAEGPPAHVRWMVWQAP
jgi:hypothetical protein